VTPRKRRTRVYWRLRGGARRAYADFRDYSEVGGRLEAQIAPGQRLATTDPDVAQELTAARVRELEAARRGRALHGETKRTTLGEAASLHLIAKKQSGRYTNTWLAAVEAYLRRVLEALGSERDPATVSVEEIRSLVAHLRRLPNGRGSTMSDGNVRHHLNALSGLFRRAGAEGYVPPGYNPVGAMLEKPVGRPQEAHWLEVPDAALLLEAARTYNAPEEGTPFGYPLIATALLTGARETELYGLELDDVSFERKTVTFRPNRWRRLKTKGSHRIVPLWPQLEAILREYLRGPHRPAGELLFPSLATGAEAMLTDSRKLLDHISARAGWKVGEIRTKMLRHTYCAARLQTLDRGAPVSIYTVARELGHTSTAMVQRVYAHLGSVRHRSAVVEYRIEQHRKVLGERLKALRAQLIRHIDPS
jgi:integrase